MAHARIPFSPIAMESRRFNPRILVATAWCIVSTIVSRFFNRRFALTLAAAACFCAKAVHILAHIDAIPTDRLVLWGASFFAQDVVFLLLLRPILDGFPTWPTLRYITTTVALFVVALVLAMASVFISFFFTAGSELQWRNIVLAGDSSSWGTLVTGLVACAVVFGVVLGLAIVLQTPCDSFVVIALDILTWPIRWLLSKLPFRWAQKLATLTPNSTSTSTTAYQHLPQNDIEGVDNQDKQESSSESGSVDGTSWWKFWSYLLVSLVLLAQIVTTIFRPVDSSMTYVSWTLLLMPVVDLTHSAPLLASMHTAAGNMQIALEDRTALTDSVPFSWLPKNGPLPGFGDWYDGNPHYSAAADPLRLTNLDQDVLPELKDKLKDVKVRHVMIFKLESTRKDVFPIKKDSLIWKTLADTFDEKKLPQEAQDRLATLTPTANFLTGDYNDGFVHEKRPRRGGINANNDFTTSSYTLKSLTGTHCGLFPIVADFNIEQAHHIYQPCLPHIVNAFNKLNGNESGAQPWRSYYMQSVTSGFDHQDKLTPKLGFETIIDKDYLRDDSKPLGAVNMSDINYYGMPENAIERYLRHAFSSAKKNNERVLLSHLTSTTHHDFGMPKGEEYVHLTKEGQLNDLSKYLNAVGFVDRWLAKVLDILEEEGVADETLLVFVGDHGLSIVEQGSITPYNNPHVGNQHVPLIFSHPKLPQIDINDAVSSAQILPTILDILISTGSLTDAEVPAAEDLLDNYEGQSLIRPLNSGTKNKGTWQFTVLNPGGSTLSVRDARHPTWHLVVPVFSDQEWRFADLAVDPHERSPVSSFDLATIVEAVDGMAKSYNVTGAGAWVEEAAVVTQWWVNENHERWRYNRLLG